jgi:hypothetical protein|tara:strand:- start:1013 stop:1696 length:684 start_codon:yes stop_codon:yes gene_type:complete
MATSNSRDFELDVAEYVEEAFERCGLQLRTGYDLKTAQRSLNLMLADWANRGLNQWTVVQHTETLVQGQTDYSLPEGAIDVLGVAYRTLNNGQTSDIIIQPIGRNEYLQIPDKSTQGQPSQYFVDKQISPKIQVWPTSNNNSDSLVFNYLRRIEDADYGPNTMQVPFRFYPCLAAGLAYYLSIKRAPERTMLLKQSYEEEFKRASDQDEVRQSYQVRPSMRSYRRLS